MVFLLILFAAVISLQGRGLLQTKRTAFPHPWDTNLTEKPSILLNILTTQSVCGEFEAPWKWFMVWFWNHSAGEKKSCLHNLKKKISFRNNMWPGTLLFCVFIDFLSWHVLSLTALIITYIQMIFKFTHFQPFQMMSPFALPQIWLPSCLGWATVFSDWIWMRWRLCHLVVNKPQKHGSSFTPLIAWAASEGQGCSMTELSPTIPLSQGINLHKTSKDICQLPSFPFLARILFISWLKLCHGPWQTPSKPHVYGALGVWLPFDLASCPQPQDTSFRQLG